MNKRKGDFFCITEWLAATHGREWRFASAVGRLRGHAVAGIYHPGTTQPYLSAINSEAGIPAPPRTSGAEFLNTY